MKKAIIISAILLTCTCHAESFTSTVYYNAPSEYIVEIPATIYVGDEPVILRATRMELRDDEYVAVTAEGDGVIQMQTADGKKQATARVYADGYLAYFRNLDSSSRTSFYILQDMVQGAGDYYGSITFNIELLKDEVTGG